MHGYANTYQDAAFSMADLCHFLGDSYFTSDPAVSSDLIAMIRYGLAPGAPGRPLEEIQRPFWRIPARP